GPGGVRRRRVRELEHRARLCEADWISRAWADALGDAVLAEVEALVNGADRAGCPGCDGRQIEWTAKLRPFIRRRRNHPRLEHDHAREGQAVDLVRVAARRSDARKRRSAAGAVRGACSLARRDAELERRRRSPVEPHELRPVDSVAADEYRTRVC